MAKTNQIKKVVNGEIADADDVNQIVENAGAEGGSVPYSEVSHERDTTGQENLGSVTYPWGTLNVNEDAYLNEVETTSPSVSASVQIKNLRRFIYQKDTPSNYSGQSGKFPAVNTSENALEFVNPPTKSTMLFCFAISGGSHVANTNGIIVNDSIVAAATEITTAYWAALGNAGGSYKTIIKTKFEKTAGVSTVTVWGSIWNSESSSYAAKLKVDIGGQNSTVTGTVGQQTPEWKSFTIDVSSLTNGTIYDVTIQLGNLNDLARTYLDSIIAFGS